MSRTHRNHSNKRGGNRERADSRPDRHISVRGVRRDPVDLRKLSRALIALAQAQAEADAQAAADAASSTKPQSDATDNHSDEGGAS